MKRISTVILSVALTAGLHSAAQADQEESNRYSVVYSTSDFSSNDNVAQLHRKIVKTAKAHCPSYFTTRSLADVNSCVRDVVADLVRNIDNPQLTAYAAGESTVELAAETDDGDSQS